LHRPATGIPAKGHGRQILTGGIRNAKQRRVAATDRFRSAHVNGLAGLIADDDRHRSRTRCIIELSTGGVALTAVRRIAAC
jgi:hypothetical protein